MSRHLFAATSVVLTALLASAAVCAQERSPAGEQLRALLAEEWDARLRNDPLAATAAGVRDNDNLLPRVAPDDYQQRFERYREHQRLLRRIDRNALTAPEQINYDLFAFVVRHELALAPYRSYRIPLSSDEGFHTEVARIGIGLVFRTVRDFESYIARLRAIPAYFDQHIANMRQGIAEGFTLPAAILPGVLSIIESQQYSSAEQTPFYEPFHRMPDAIDGPTQSRLREAGREAIRGAVIPAYGRLLEFFRDRYVPAARHTLAASDLPDGRAYYAALVRFFTNLDVTPEEVHDIGSREVARIRTQMESVIQESGFKGDFAAFLTFLRTDPQFYASTPEQLLKEASYLAKRIDGMLPAYFGSLPRLPYSVQPVPSEIAANYTGGRYVPAPIGGTRGGEYWVNTHALATRPLYNLPALTLHEAVPGHHLQMAIARELADVPPFRRELYPHAFGEGWALYAEKLGEEMGLYQTPYEQFGRLTYEMWRACRLVVDTGIHAKGWSRKRAFDFLASNTALSTHEVRTEVDRYIAWPGQALAYKIGELKILELRAKARSALGARFDIRAFHDAVLANGGVPLPVLEAQIERYINEALQ